ncbi:MULTISPECIES: outer membrane beta-barrel family protein [Dyadobacter]|uniref:TonB-dependent receptor n=1 Tax=Dyadobacter psychrotolerans TaxID=2541721 RepID=A0A4R5DMI4_9BACT|nr:outer membrane beta-barrel family protein [Dyadobacter psychrotolerans]TDE13260.1 TonB-dependent receptor [Dyadobacter psychrotolerans]
MKPLISTLLLLLFVFANAYSQSKSGLKITGKITDVSTSKPVEYASVGLTNQLTNKVVNGAVTDTTGFFEIVGVMPGSYAISIDFIGYQKKELKDILIKDGSKALLLNTIAMTPSVKMLAEVTVSGHAAIVENQIDKIVYNAGNDITSQSGVALDVLKKVPQVSVDIDGNVELQGNPNVRFLINGKPSSVFGNSLTDALASIPASQIKSIEAITSPGAKYDAQGTGGIINIILKDNRLQGINGNVNLSGGTRLENGSVNLNFRRNNFGVNAFFSGNKQLSSRTPSTQDRLSTNISDTTTIRLLQNGYQDFQRSGYRSGIGFDWTLSKKDNLIGAVGYNNFSSKSAGITDIIQTVFNAANAPISSTDLIRNSNSNGGISAIDWSLNYIKKFKKDGQELNVLYSSSFGRPLNNYSQIQNYSSEAIPYSGTSGNTPGNDKQTNISIDYAHPVTKKFLIETGVKTVLQDINSNADVRVLKSALNQFVPDLTQSYHLNYNMKIYAGYLSTTFSMFNWLNVKAGARFEHTDVKIDYPNTFIPSYNNLVPSLIFSHNFKDEQSLKLAFTRRIERAEYREINPFMNLSDPYNITAGNPLLKPEIGNNFELGYNKAFNNGGSVYIALVERINTSDIKPYTTFYPSYLIGDSTYQNVSVTNRQNIGTEYNSGVSVSGSMPLTDHLNLRGNFVVTQKRVVNNLLLTDNVTNGTNWRFNLNATYLLPKDLILEGFGNYSSAINTIQGKRPQQLTYNFAFRKQFYHKNASIGFTAINPFTKYISQVTTIRTANYIATNNVLVPYRSFGISLTYKFGKLEFKKGKDQSNDFLHSAPSTDN